MCGEARYLINALKFLASLKYSHSLQSNFITPVGGTKDICKTSPKLGVLLEKCYSLH